MLKKFSSYISNNKKTCVLFCALSFIAIFFTLLFSFFVFQSDDYYYASFFKNGLSEFFNLSVNHFLTFNGRALVHFFAEVALSLPRWLTFLFSGAILFLIVFFACKIIDFVKTDFSLVSCMCIFYSLLLFTGRDIFKEGFMWISAFYNYVFPFLLLLTAAYFSDKKYSPLLFFFAGATTEQWGITAVAFASSVALSSVWHKKLSKKTLSVFISPLSSLLGYATIFLSPATLSRIDVTGHTSLHDAIVDLPRISNIFISRTTLAILILVFIALCIFTAHNFKKSYSSLYFGFLPALLIVLSFFTQKTLIAFIVSMCFFVLCAAIFFINHHTYLSAFITGAIVSVIIMIPTNTFEARIVTPSALLITSCCVSLFLLNFEFIKSSFRTPLVLFTMIIGLIVFFPTFSGFMHNGKIELENLAAIGSAHKTDTLIYNIDYDKNYASKQMFNDGWFFNEFVSLYSLEDCRIVIKSQNSVKLDSVSSYGINCNGDIYVPVRELISELGGDIDASTDTTVTLNGKSFTISNGMITYFDENSSPKYLIADLNKLPEFYTLYLKLDVFNDALGTDIHVL